MGWCRGGGPAGTAPKLPTEGTKNSRANINRFMEGEYRRLLLFPYLFGWQLRLQVARPLLLRGAWRIITRRCWHFPGRVSAAASAALSNASRWPRWAIGVLSVLGLGLPCAASLLRRLSDFDESFTTKERYNPVLSSLNGPPHCFLLLTRRTYGIVPFYSSSREQSRTLGHEEACLVQNNTGHFLPMLQP